MSRKKVLLCCWTLAACLALAGTTAMGLAAPAPQQAPSARTKAMGTVQSITNGALTIKTDAGSEIKVATPPSTRVLRVSAGQTSLRQAAHIQLNDVQPGDRVLAVGQAAGSPSVITASSVIVMKRSDVEQKQRQEQLQWQNSSVGGLVQTVDPTSQTVTIKSRVKGAPAIITIHTSPSTVLRRYAAGSVRFQDAKAAPFDQIKPGDQLRARGVVSADGKTVNAAEIISGTFRNVAGRITDVDEDTGEITVKDLLSKEPVEVKITRQSEIRELPEDEADRIAREVKGADGAPQSSAGSSPAGEQKAANSSEPPNSSQAAPKTSGRVDMDQLVRNLPPVHISDLKKGDAVMIVSTEGADQTVTAIKLVSGVDPILSAPPGKNRAAALKSLWSGFSTAGGGSSGSSSSSSSSGSGSDTQ